MVFKMINELEVNTMSEIAMPLWTIWWRRNQKCRNDKVPTVFEVNRKARDTWQEWSKAQSMKMHDGCNRTAEGNKKWIKPPPGMLKCNVDAACYAEQNFFCVAACLRDDNG
ncbi:putative ribonuclease H protein, partial [Trifolium medium]|nr:putative ribonuclease H protein [Trifolium medium]